MTRSLGEFEQVILFSVLRLGEEAYGLAIAEEIEARTGRRVSPGAIYTTLRRLVDRGLVTAEVEEDRSESGRPRKFHYLTPAGARALRETVETLQAVSEGLMGRLTELVGEGS